MKINWKAATAAVVSCLCFAAVSVTRATADAAVPNPATSAPTYSLLMKYHAGDQHRYKMTMDMIINMDTGGGTGTQIPAMNSHTETIMLQTVKSVDASTGDATLTTQILKMTETMNGKPMTMPGGDQLTQQMEQPSDSVMAPDGKIISMKLPDAEQKQISPMLGNNFMSGMQGVNFLPDAPVAIGHVWRCPMSFPQLGMDFNMDCKLKSVDATKDGNVANVGVNIDGDLGDIAKAMKLPVNMKGTVIGNGTQKFNIDQGLLDGSAMSMEVNMSMVGSGAGQSAPAGMPPMKMKMHMTMGYGLDDGDTTPVPPVATPSSNNGNGVTPPPPPSPGAPV